MKNELGEKKYVNNNCWLTNTLGYPPVDRCRYCQLKFNHCIFSRYLFVSFVLIAILFTTSLIVEGEISKLTIVIIFVLVLVYGHFFSKSTEKIIKANFGQQKATEKIEEMNKTLEKKVKQRTKDLEKACRKLQRIDKAKTEFISIVSHQLRTPLSVMKGHLSMVNEGIYDNEPQKKKEVLEDVYEANERLIDLVNDVLNASRIQAGKVELHKEEVNIVNLCENAITRLGTSAKEKGIDILFHQPLKEISPVQIDLAKIENVLLNLIDNATKYTSDGIIEISVKQKEKWLLIKVKDTGEGMSKEEIDKLFETFSRGGAGKRYWVQGSGLGLYIARQFIEMHGGKIWAKSAGKGKGSIFYIKLPV